MVHSIVCTLVISALRSACDFKQLVIGDLEYVMGRDGFSGSRRLESTLGSCMSFSRMRSHKQVVVEGRSDRPAFIENRRIACVYRKRSIIAILTIDNKKVWMENVVAVGVSQGPLPKAVFSSMKAVFSKSSERCPLRSHDQSCRFFAARVRVMCAAAVPSETADSWRPFRAPLYMNKSGEKRQRRRAGAGAVHKQQRVRNDEQA